MVTSNNLIIRIIFSVSPFDKCIRFQNQDAILKLQFLISFNIFALTHALMGLSEVEPIRMASVLHNRYLVPFDDSKVIAR